MRIGTPQKEVKKPLFTLFYILFSLIVSNLLCQRRFYGHSKCAYHISTVSIHYNDE